MKIFQPSCRISRIVLLAGGIALGVGAAPRLSMSCTTWDFGGIPPGAPAVCTFSLLNRGDAPLHVLEVQISCSGCLDVQLDRKTVAPGEAATLTAALKVSGGAGPFRERIRLRTDDPSHSIVRLEIRGRFVTAWRLDPGPVLRLGGVRADAAREWKFKISLMWNEPWRIRNVQMPQGFHVNAEPEPGTNAYLLTIRYDGRPLSALPVRGRMVVITDQERAPRLFIPFVIWGRSKLRAFPPALVLRPNGATAYQGTVRIVSLTGETFAVTRAVGPSEAFRISWLPGVRRGHRLTIFCSGIRDVPGLTRRIRIETDHAGSLEIPVTISPSPSADVAAIPTSAANQSLYPPAIAVRAAETSCGISAAAAARAITAGDPTAKMLVWTAARLAEHEPGRQKLRELLGGITLTKLVRIREKIRSQMQKDAAFAKRCRITLDRARRVAEHLSVE